MPRVRGSAVFMSVLEVLHVSSCMGGQEGAGVRLQRGSVWL